MRAITLLEAEAKQIESQIAGLQADHNSLLAAIASLRTPHIEPVAAAAMPAAMVAPKEPQLKGVEPLESEWIVHPDRSDRFLVPRRWSNARRALRYIVDEYKMGARDTLDYKSIFGDYPVGWHVDYLWHLGIMERRDSTYKSKRGARCHRLVYRVRECFAAQVIEAMDREEP